MTESLEKSLVSLQHTRNKVFETLRDSYANDLLSLEDYERRLQHAQNLDDIESLQFLVRDLHPPSNNCLDSNAYAQELVSPELVPNTRLIVAIFGGSDTHGNWILPKKTTVLALMGGVELDLRNVRLSSGIHEIFVAAVFGGISMIVPPGTIVELNGIGIMGGFEQSPQATPTNQVGSPVIRVTGCAFMGGVSVEERMPGESSGDAKRRRKAIQKQLRSESKKALKPPPKDG